MRYALAVLTHDDGSQGETLAATIRSFDRHTDSPPVARFVVQDGPCALPPVAPYPWQCLTLPKQSGFCRATKALWDLAAGTDGHEYDYVFWLEHDFAFKRYVSIGRMAAILDDEGIAQVSLMRGPANDEELAAGGVVEAMSARGSMFKPCAEYGTGWLRHSAYFTTNPSLMSREFMRDNPWPDYHERCEGRYGLDLIARGFDFAIMGDGEPWIEHTGQRTGKGY